MIRSLTLFLLLPLTSLSSQNNTIDSLRTILPAAEGKARMEILFSLSNMLEGVIPREAYNYGIEGLALAQQFGDSLTAATFLSSLAYSSTELGEFSQALTFAYRSLELSRKLGDKKRIASANSTIGIASVYLGRYSKALEHHLEALRIREELGLKVPTANTLNNIGIAYHNIGQYEKAVEYYKRALSVHGEKVSNSIRARYYTNIGFSEFKRGRVDTAKAYLREAERLSSGSPYGVVQAYLFLTLGTLHADQGDHAVALTYLRRSLSSYSALDQKHGKVQLYNALASVHIKLRQFPPALRYLDSAVAVASQVNVPDQLMASYEQYHRIYQQTGPLTLEYHFFRKFIEAKELLRDRNESSQVAEAMFNHVTEEQQRTIELLKKEKTIAELNADREAFRSRLLYGGVGLAVIAVGLLYRVNVRIRRNNLTIASTNEELKRLNDELQEKIGEVNLLTGFLPICSNCKKIRDDNGQWEQMEQYISKRSEAIFSHGICPECMKSLYGKVISRYKAEE